MPPHLFPVSVNGSLQVTPPSHPSCPVFPPAQAAPLLYASQLCRPFLTPAASLKFTLPRRIPHLDYFHTPFCTGLAPTFSPSAWNTLSFVHFPPPKPSSSVKPFMISPCKMRRKSFPSGPLAPGTYASVGGLDMWNCPGLLSRLPHHKAP